MFPISQIVINHKIPRGHSFYETTFDKIELPNLNNYDLRITNLTCQLDTSALYNIKTKNIARVYRGNDSNPFNITLNPGYYTSDSITSITSDAIQFENGYAYLHEYYPKIDLTDAPDLQNILKVNTIWQSPERSAETCDFSNGLNEFKIYSSVVKQSYSDITCPLTDFFVTAAIGLNNLVTYENLSIPVNVDHNFMKVWYILKNCENEEIAINSDIYINYVISILPK